MTARPQTPLAEYIGRLMEELNFQSERAFAAYLGVSHSTINRILHGGRRVDPDSLHVIAEGLHVPVENLFRLAGYLPPEDMKSQVLREIEKLLRDLPGEDQERILDLVRVEYRHHKARRGTETRTRSAENQTVNQDSN